MHYDCHIARNTGQTIHSLLALSCVLQHLELHPPLNSRKIINSFTAGIGDTSYTLWSNQEKNKNLFPDCWLCFQNRYHKKYFFLNY